MLHKSYLDDRNRITLSCPQCRRTKDVDMSAFLDAQGPVKITYRFKCDVCTCGHQVCEDCKEFDCIHANRYVIDLERRRFYRKDVNLTGSLRTLDNRLHPVRILNLSRIGLKLNINTRLDIQTGDIFAVEFTLDDTKQSLIKKEIIVRQANVNTIDGEFSDTLSYDRYDRAIGFYLMQ